MSLIPLGSDYGHNCALGTDFSLPLKRTPWVPDALIRHTLGFQHNYYRCFSNALNIIRIKKQFHSKLSNRPLSITRQKIKRKKISSFFHKVYKMQPLLPFPRQRHIFLSLFIFIFFVSENHNFQYVFVHVKEPFSNLALEMKPQVHSERKEYHLFKCLVPITLAE